MNLHSYPDVYALGHKATEGILAGDVIIQEKVDGSQFSFGVDGAGALQMRSKGAEVYQQCPGMFDFAVETCLGLRRKLQPGWTYRGEYLRKPHHNTLTYERVPKANIVLFDINDGLESYLRPGEVWAWADRLGLECVPTLHEGTVPDLKMLLDTQSILGGPIEGIVIKPRNYDLFGRDKKVVMAKLVREDFKEVHQKTWRKEHGRLGPGEFVEQLAEQYRTEARWEKAVQHLRDAGRLEGEPRDIGLLMKEVPDDVLKECTSEILDRTMAWVEPQLRRLVTRGLPEWYKRRLAAQAMERANSLLSDNNLERAEP